MTALQLNRHAAVRNSPGVRRRMHGGAPQHTDPAIEDILPVDVRPTVPFAKGHRSDIKLVHR